MRKTKQLMVAVALTLGSYTAQAQNNAPAIQWQKAFGANGSILNAESIQQTSDGGYIAVSSTAAGGGDVTGFHGGSDMWVVKTNSNGVLQWQKSLGGSDIDVVKSVQQTTDGGYIVVGYTESTDGDVTSNHGGKDVWLVKLSSTGAIQWQKTYGGSQNEEGNSVVQTTDGGYIVTGYTESSDGDIVNKESYYWDILLLKISSNGTLQWQKTFGGYGYDYATHIHQTSDGGYIVLCNNGIGSEYWYPQTSNIYVKSDKLALKLTNSGAIDWVKNVGGAYESDIQQTSDGGYIVVSSSLNAADTISLHGNDDFMILKLTQYGAEVWRKIYGGTEFDHATSVIQTTDGGYIVAGFTASNNGDVAGFHGISAGNNNGTKDAWIIKLNDIGDLQWQKALGGSRDEFAYCIATTADGGFIVGGYSDAQTADGDVTSFLNSGGAMWLVKFSSANCVNGVLNVPAITGSTVVCKNSTIQLNNSLSGGVWSSNNAYASVNATTGMVTGLNAGTASIQYKVTSGGCSGVATTSIAVSSNLVTPSIAYAAGTVNPQNGAGGGNNYCKNKTFTVVGTPSGGVWSSTGVITVNPTTGLLNTGNSLGAGSLTYTATLNGCKSSKTLTANIVSCFGSRGVASSNEQLLSSNEFTLYPNPAHSSISLNLKTLVGAGNIVVADLYGKQIKTQALSMGSNTVDVSSLSKGFYLVSIITSEGKTTKKLVVE